MPLTRNTYRKKTISFLHGMVIGTFSAVQTYAADWEADELAGRLKVVYSGYHDSFVKWYAQVVTFTENLEFHWLPDTPEELKQFETYWKKIKRGDDEVECFEFYMEHVPNYVLTGERGSKTKGWNNAVQEAIRPWVPLETRPESELTPEQAADPNSNSVGLQQKEA
jgi:hypothetical protein